MNVPPLVPSNPNNKNVVQFCYGVNVPPLDPSNHNNLCVVFCYCVNVSQLGLMTEKLFTGTLNKNENKNKN